MLALSYDKRSHKITSTDDLGDGALLAQLASGDADALLVIYRRYSRRIFSLILRIVGSEPEAEEVLQDVFLDLWQHVSQYDERRGSLLSWLFVIAHSRSVDRLRSRLGLTLKRHEVQGEPLTTGHRAQETGKQDEILERALILRKALLSLPPEQREVIELGYFEGFSQSEIAGRLNEPLGTVKGRARLALQKLRACLASDTDVAEGH